MIRGWNRSGFTLLELLVVTAIAAIVLSLGLPAWQTLAAELQVGAWQRQLHNAFYYTRNHAIYSGTSTVICARGPDGGCADEGGRWHGGWLVFEDPDGRADCRPGPQGHRCSESGARILRLSKGPERARIATNHNVARRVRYNALGLSYGYTGRFTLCAGAPEVRDKGLVIANTGRVRRARPGELLSCSR